MKILHQISEESASSPFPKLPLIRSCLKSKRKGVTRLWKYFVLLTININIVETSMVARFALARPDDRCCIIFLYVC